MSDTLNEYAFDVMLAGALRVKGSDEADARRQIAEAIEAAETNFGAWRDGSPILGETSLRGVPSLYEVNGEEVPPLVDPAHPVAYECPDCDWTGAADDLDGVGRARHLSERISMGELVPAGVCPECGALVEVKDADVPNHTLHVVAAIMRERGWTVGEPRAPVESKP